MPRTTTRTWTALLIPLAAAAGLAALCSAGPAPVPTEKPGPGEAHKDRPLLRAAAYRRAVARATRDAPDAYQVWDFEFNTEEDCVAFKGEGVYVDARFHRFAQAMFKDEKVLDRVEAPGLVWGEPVGVAVVPPPPPLTEAGEKGPGTPEKVVRGGLDGLTGKGVLLAIVDSGVDFRHPDFQADGKSRLLYFWDTLLPYDRKLGEAAPVTFPDGAPIGTILSQQDLNDDLAGKTHLATTDRDGHGTACAGIAAGRGEIDEACKGVAPDVDLIAVRIASGEVMENGFLLPSICEWLSGIAKKRNEPVVISCSFGGQYGGHDGARIEERWLDEVLPERAPGRLMCIAAGNEGDKDVHARVKVSQGERGHLSWVARDEKNGAVVMIYVDGVQPDDVDVKPSGDTAFTSEVDKQFLPLNQSLRILVEVPKGRGGLFLALKQGKEVTADAYVLAASDQPARFTEGAVNAGQIASPGSARCPFTIGSYDFDDRFERNGKISRYGKNFFDKKSPPLTFGDLSEYSNAGFLRSSGVVKPDLVAPGRYFTAPASADGGIVQALFRGGKNDKYQAFDGTSAATPYAAGVLALLLQEQPTLTARDLRNVLSKKDGDGLTKDKKVPVWPDPQWGYGKLDLQAAKNLVAAFKSK